LSGGEQQRVALARAFINEPLVYSPTSHGNLDAETSRSVIDIMLELNSDPERRRAGEHDQRSRVSQRKRSVAEREMVQDGA